MLIVRCLLPLLELVVLFFIILIVLRPRPRLSSFLVLVAFWSRSMHVYGIGYVFCKAAPSSLYVLYSVVGKCSFSCVLFNFSKLELRWVSRNSFYCHIRSNSFSIYSNYFGLDCRVTFLLSNYSSDFVDWDDLENLFVSNWVWDFQMVEKTLLMLTFGCWPFCYSDRLRT